MPRPGDSLPHSDLFKSLHIAARVRLPLSISIISAEVEPFVSNDSVFLEDDSMRRASLSERRDAGIVCKEDDTDDGDAEKRGRGYRGGGGFSGGRGFQRGLRRAEIKSHRDKELIRLSLSISPLSLRPFHSSPSGKSAPFSARPWNSPGERRSVAGRDAHAFCARAT